MSTSTLSNWRPNTSSNNCSGVSVSDDGNYIYATQYGVTTNQFTYSVDGGINWTTTTISISDGTATNFYACYCSPSGKYVYISNYGKYYYYSTDYGSTFNSYYWGATFTSNVGICMTQSKTHLVLFASPTGYVVTSYANPPKVHLTFSGTLNSTYVTTTSGGYMYYAFATGTQTLALSSVSGSVPIYIMAVGSGGSGSIGNATLNNNCNGGAGGGMAYGIYNCTASDTLSITIGTSGNPAISTSNGYATSAPSIGTDTTVFGNTITVMAYAGA